MMKNILLFVLSLAFSLNSFAQFPEGFESGDIPSGWTSFRGENNLGTNFDWINLDNAGYAYSGQHAMLVQTENTSPDANEDWLVTPQFTVDSQMNLLSFYQGQLNESDAGTVYTIRVSTASQTTHADFSIVDTQSETDFPAAAFSQHVVDLSAYAGMSIYVAFVQKETTSGDAWVIDEVDMKSPATAPDAVTTPMPVDGGVNISLYDSTDGTSSNNVDFSWEPATTGDPATSYKFALGVDANSLQVLGTVNDSSVSIGQMNYSTTYYWQIIPINIGGEGTPSPVWSFTTEEASGPDAVTTPTPANQAVDVVVDSANNNSVRVSWVPATTGDAATSYKVELYSAQGSSSQTSFTGTVTNTSTIISNLSINTTYIWRVTPINSAGQGQASEIWSFTTGSGSTALVDVFNNSDVTSFYNNRLNVLVLKSSLSPFTSVNLYDLLGKQVLSKSLNSNEEYVDLSTIKSGVYVVKTTIGNTVNTFKFVKN